MRILMATALAAATTLTGATFTATSASAQSGSFTQSCRNVSNLGNGAIAAECADSQGRFRSSTLQANTCVGDIGNNNGLLSCNGAVAQGGAYVPDNNNNRNKNKGNSAGALLGAGALGAVAGAVLNSRFNNQNLYQQGYSYPDYGQQGYGDPRRDPRFAQGGWGYGSNGQWVPISRRADWLDGRIDDGQRSGSISRREAQSLRAELNDIIEMERSYGRNGFTNSERAQLDDRFDQLASRIRFERRDDDNRPGYGGGYQGGNNGYQGGGYQGGGYNNGNGYNNGGGYNRGY